MTWVMAVVYPLIAVFIIDKVRFIEYFQNSRESFVELGHLLSRLAAADMLILSSGLLGAVLAGVTIKLLRKKGYAMF